MRYRSAMRRAAARTGSTSCAGLRSVLACLMLTALSGCEPPTEISASNIGSTPFRRLSQMPASEQSIAEVLDQHRDRLREFLLENDFACDAASCSKELFHVETIGGQKTEMRWNVAVFLPARAGAKYKLNVQATSNTTTKYNSMICGNDPSNLTPLYFELSGESGEKKHADIVFKFQGTKPCTGRNCKIILMDGRQKTIFAELRIDSGNVEYCSSSDGRRNIYFDGWMHRVMLSPPPERNRDPAWKCVGPRRGDLGCVTITEVNRPGEADALHIIRSWRFDGKPHIAN